MPAGDELSDLALLRRFEPVIKYTQGELFLPGDVNDYVGSASLQAARRNGPVEVLAARGTLTLDSLASLGRKQAGDKLYLTFVDRPLDRGEFKAWKKDPERPRFTPSSRFAAVGILSRLIDSLMRMTLILRGKVPGGYAAAAALRMRSLPSAGVHPYYGHVSRDGGYIILQYWYFYAMNDWRCESRPGARCRTFVRSVSPGRSSEPGVQVSRHRALREFRLRRLLGVVRGSRGWRSCFPGSGAAGWARSLG